MRFSEKKVEASRNFSNKLWNAARFVLMNLSDDEPAPHIPDELNLEDKWIINRYNTVLKEVTESLEKFEMALRFKSSMTLSGMSSATGILSFQR